MRRTVRETLDVSVAAPTCFSNVVAIMLLLLLLLFLFIFLLIFRFLLCQITHENVWKMRFLFRAKVSNWRQSFFCIFRTIKLLTLSRWKFYDVIDVLFIFFVLFMFFVSDVKTGDIDSLWMKIFFQHSRSRFRILIFLRGGGYSFVLYCNVV